MEAIQIQKPSLNVKQASDRIAFNSSENKSFDQKAKEHLLNGFNPLKNKNNENSVINIQAELEKELFDDNFICPIENCGQVFSGRTNLETLKRLELKKVLCNECRNYFKFMLCPHCNKKVYLSIEIELKFFQDPYGFTITCPYVKSCGKAFFKIKCGECGEVQTHKEAKAENSVLKCADNRCGKQTNFIRCPKAECKELIVFKSSEKNEFNEFTNDSSDYNYVKNTALNLFNKRITCTNSLCRANFIKFLCNKCNMINFTYSSDYFDGVEIICQNKNCDAVFKKVNCPFCLCENNFPKLILNQKDAVLGDQYENMHIPDLIKCRNNSCLQTFSKINCPSCKTENYSKGMKNFLEGKKIKCASAPCATEFSYYNCVICNQINFWNKSKKANSYINNNLIDLNVIQADSENQKIFNHFYAENNERNEKKGLVRKEIKDAYVRGQPVKCANCKITTSKINCPFCFETVTFSDFPCKYGVNYTCFNPKCMQNFYINLCPCCTKTKIRKGKRDYANFLSCPSKKETKEKSNQNLSLNFNLKLNLGEFKCEYKYDFVFCSQCTSFLYYYENQFNPNMALRCPQDTCKCLFLSFNCGKCFEKILLRENQLEEEFVSGECPNRACKNPFKFIYCLQCKFISETNLADKLEYSNSQKSFRKNSALSNSKTKSTKNSQNIFCVHCAESKDNDITNNINNSNALSKKADCETPLKSNEKQDKAVPVCINPFIGGAVNNPNGKHHCKSLLNFSEEEKGGKKFNILKSLSFADGIFLWKPVYQLDSKPDEFSKSLKKKLSKSLISVYNGNPTTYERCFDCKEMRESLVLFAPCGHKTSCEECCKQLYTLGIFGNSSPKKCTKCDKRVSSYVKKIYN